MLGTGVSGLLWSADRGGVSRQSMFFLDFTGGVKPYLLNQMDNHIGALTRVQYSPSTRFYLEDQKKPATHWKTPLPFPVQVVSRVEVIDEISRGKLTTEYRYHHGYWDGAEREFRGFGRVDQLDTELFGDFHAAGLHPDRPFEAVKIEAFSPPTETRTWFHQGPIGDEFGDWNEADFSGEFWADDPQMLSRPASMAELLKALPRRVKRDALRALRGTILRTELYALDGTERRARPYTVTESLPVICAVVDQGDAAVLACDPAELPGDWTMDSRRRAIFFPHGFGQRTTQWERGNDPLTQFAFTDDYDTFGQARRQTEIACPRGWRTLDDRPNSNYLTTRTRTLFASPSQPDTYIVNRVARTTSYELDNHGDVTVANLRDLPDTDPSLVLIGQTYNYYDGQAFQGLPYGIVSAYGALVRSESLVLTEEILHDTYRSEPLEEPPYLTSSGAPPLWTADYPEDFQARVPALAGYAFHAGGPDPEDKRGFFTQSERRRYDFQAGDANANGRGLVYIQRDPLGRDIRIDYDNFELLGIRIADAANLITEAQYDYRLLQPGEVTDPNGNRCTFTFSPLGLLQSSFIQGKAGGGDQQRPSVQLEYDFLAFDAAAQPISVRTIRQTHHDTEIDIPLPARDETIESIEYSDGFGRLLQMRMQAGDLIFGDPLFGGAVLPADQNDQTGTLKSVVGQNNTDRHHPNVVVNGWQIYDNKGQIVQTYEPFFSIGWDYTRLADSKRGQKIEMQYDPRGQMVRKLNPDGSEQRVIYGVPGRAAAPDLANPEVFEPTPWEAYTYDANDNAGRTHPATSVSFQHHWNTPSNIAVDALGRTVDAVERNRTRQPDGTWAAIEEYHTKSTYDIQGNLLTVTDALGRVAFMHAYDLARHPLRIESIDAGLRRTVLDAVGNVVEQRDSKGALLLRAYDRLNRPIRFWARDGIGQTLTLRERLEYGDGGNPNQPATERNANVLSNRLGKPARQYDEAGMLAFESYDFKGNVLEKVRQVIGDTNILAVFNAPRRNGQVQAFRVDWQPPRGWTLEDYAVTLLDGQDYRTSITYDALNRIKVLHYPQDVDGVRQQLRPHYNRAGALERLTLADPEKARTLGGMTFVQHISYNAKGQRSFIVYGNGVFTRQAYDPRTFRMVRLRTEHCTQPSEDAYRPTGEVLQDFAYSYDMAGNITAFKDRTPASGIPNTLLGTDALDRAFTYDPLYRLIASNGRECVTSSPDLPWEHRPKCQDVKLTRAYEETYIYDRVGNMINLRHSTGPTRTFKPVSSPNNRVPDSNRLASLTIGQTDFHYTYDAGGNLIQETSSRHFEWDHSDRMRAYRTQPENADASIHAHYLYDAGGQRVKKLVRNQGGQVEVTIYVDSMFEHHRVVRSNAENENNTLHVMDNLSRVALVRVGRPLVEDNTPAVKYQLGDHLGSSNVVVDEAGDWTSREEVTPFGETSFGSYAHKRYRFTGMERDEESGLYYFGARYYAVWLGRWVSCDPAGLKDGTNIYAYTRSNPIKFIDLNGAQASDPAARPRAPNTISEVKIVGHAITPEEERQLTAEERVSILFGQLAERNEREAAMKTPLPLPPEDNTIYMGVDGKLGTTEKLARYEMGERITLVGQASIAASRGASLNDIRAAAQAEQMASGLLLAAGEIAARRSIAPNDSTPRDPEISLISIDKKPYSPSLKEMNAMIEAVRIGRATGSTQKAGTAGHTAVGAAPKGPDVVDRTAPGETRIIEYKFNFTLYGGIPENVMTNALKQVGRYAETYEKKTGIKPIVEVRIFNPLRFQWRVGP
ncbi:toxin TcdB middle/N-terminal domain-containing protein [Paraburkholderia terrae]|nr:toxin TcdB middle/N-terminal domain-containing protein [Paraburkholderia terrae]